MTNEIKPIEIFSSNLITSASQISSSSTQEGASSLLIDGRADILWQSAHSQEAAAYIEITLPYTAAADAVLIKNTDFSALSLAYKTDAEQTSYTAFSDFSLNVCGDDIFVKFNSPLSFKILKITCLGQQSACNIGQLIICKSLIILDDVLSSLDQDIYFKGGSHYLEDGSLVLWKEFTKQALTLTLNNVSKNKKTALENIFKTNDFLTYVFYGPYEMSLSSQYGLKRPAQSSLDRVMSLYKISLQLLER